GTTHVRYNISFPCQLQHPASIGDKDGGRELFPLHVILGLLLGCSALVDEAAGQAPQVTKKIALTINYGDGVEKRFTAISWKPEMTVLDVLEAARKHPRGIRFKYRGSKERAFLYQIDDVTNEGKGDNWIFRINKKLAGESFAVTRVNAGDVILWEFGEYK
ncbi:MAG: DUF4430 domain-containing protein, partial [Pirellulaceae bacterium]